VKKPLCISLLMHTAKPQQPQDQPQLLLVTSWQGRVASLTFWSRRNLCWSGFTLQQGRVMGSPIWHLHCSTCFSVTSHS